MFNLLRGVFENRILDYTRRARVARSARDFHFWLILDPWNGVFQLWNVQDLDPKVVRIPKITTFWLFLDPWNGVYQLWNVQNRVQNGPRTTQTDRQDGHTDKQAFLDSYTIGPSGNNNWRSWRFLSRQTQRSSSRRCTKITKECPNGGSLMQCFLL